MISNIRGSNNYTSGRDAVDSEPGPSCSRTSDSCKSPRSVSLNSVSNLMQIDCSFVDVDSSVISNILSSIHAKDAILYKSTVHIFLEECMSKSLKYLRMLKVEPLTSKEKIDLDPTPEKDGYIVSSTGKYERLQYMCDYFKYYVLGNDAEVADSLEENVSSCIEEKDCAERIELINKLLYRDERVCPNRDHVSLYGPEVDVPIMGTDKRILYARNGYSRRLTLKRLMESNDSGSPRPLTDASLISKFTPVVLPKKPIKNDSNIKKMKASNNILIANSTSYAADFMDHHFSLMDKFKETDEAKKIIRMNAKIKEMELARSADLKARDSLINHFMEYYLSLRDKFERIARVAFREKATIIADEFELPIPIAQREVQASSSCKTDKDMEVVRTRMVSYLSKIKYIKNNIIISCRGKSFLVPLKDAGKDKDSAE
ncbi:MULTISPECIES: hypothetical protein [Candidatus Ichthyocystis]|uniref:Putative coiled coil protein n=1 Tax=Candidatus Ichthyocystis hellenicum TaxID=1561003 RepID=A0A0S4M2U4_9BURK|nr:MULTISPECIES: hypothetical protein [Ichthyocystis]CUT17953.1 putative coiled coil protein [Candidatus Ichthyocystis hellenicum]